MKRTQRKIALDTHLDNYWVSLSDDELIAKTFTICDPESLADFSAEFPPTDQHPIIEYTYDCTGTKHSNIRCVHCKYPNHKKGIVLQISDGRRFLVEHECAAKLYGAHFTTILQDFESAQTRARLIARMRRLRAALPQFNAYLFEFRTSQSIQSFEQFRSQFSKTMPRLWGELKIAHHNNQGNLLVQREVPDPIAENRADQEYQESLAEWKAKSSAQRKKYYRPQPPVKPIYKTIIEKMGKLPTPTFFGDANFSEPEFDMILAEFAKLSTDYQLDEKALSAYRLRAKYDPSEAQYRKDPSEITSVMKLTLWQSNQLLDKLEEQVARLSEPFRLFTPPVLDAICQWANAHTQLRCTYKVAPRTIYETDSAGVVRTLSLPQTFKIPSRDAIDSFRRAIS
jgi:hypothetical protein